MLLANIAKIFDNLRKINMKLNPKRCSFEVEEGKFLGYMVTSEGIRANPKKAKALADLCRSKVLDLFSLFFFEYLHFELPEDVVSIIFGIILELQLLISISNSLKHHFLIFEAPNLVNIMTNTSHLHVLSLQQHRNSNIDYMYIKS
ncbi:hypothetical protein Tco_1245845 [Tanacetum coccineum]